MSSIWVETRKYFEDLVSRYNKVNNKYAFLNTVLIEIKEKLPQIKGYLPFNNPFVTIFRQDFFDKMQYRNLLIEYVDIFKVIWLTNDKIKHYFLGYPKLLLSLIKEAQYKYFSILMPELKNIEIDHLVVDEVIKNDNLKYFKILPNCIQHSEKAIKAKAFNIVKWLVDNGYVSYENLPFEFTYDNYSVIYEYICIECSEINKYLQEISYGHTLQRLIELSTVKIKETKKLLELYIIPDITNEILKYL